MRHLLALSLTTVMLSVLTACATAPASRFYLLVPLTGDTTMHASSIALAIGVGPVELPKYLSRPQIAVRTGANELVYSETHRWAETLQDNVSDVLAENLGLLVPTDKVSVFPWGRSTTIDYQVVAEISRFDADANGNVVLAANWRLYSEESREVVVEKRSVFTEPVGGTGYTEIVAAQSRALAALSQEIAGAIRAASSH
jgi:uncharacterized lipoprotein YmbA